MKKSIVFLILAASLYGCAALKPEKEKAAPPPYPKRLPLPQGATSALDLPLKPRVPLKEAKGWLGIFMEEVTGPEHGLKPEEKGIRASFIVEGSPADEGGLREGDVLTALDGQSFSTDNNIPFLASFKKKLEEKGAGGQAVFTLLRKEERFPITVTLGSPLRTEPLLKEHPEWEGRKEGPSLLELTLDQAGARQDAEKVLEKIRENSYEIGSYKLIPKEGKQDPFRLGEVNTLLHFPMRGGEMAQGLSKRMQEGLRKRDLAGLVKTAAGEIDAAIPVRKEKDRAALWDFDDYLIAWRSALAEARKKMDAAFAGLTGEERDFLFDSAPGLIRQDPDEPEEEPTKEKSREAEENLLKFLRLAAKVDYEKLLDAFIGPLELADFHYFDYLNGLTDRTRELTKTHPLHPGRPGVEGEVLADEDSPVGRIVVGGPGRNVYALDAAVIIDLGGDDIYLNSAGGTREKIPLSIVIDLNGNDTYRAAEDFSQGSGRMGLGMLVDLKGDDLYEAENYSQGAGFFGLGVLYDGEGNDRFGGKTGDQGAGLFGCGLLLDSEGDDSFHAQLYSQGFGMTKGFGALVDGKGDDLYFAGREYPDSREPGRAFQSMSQGFGFGLRPFKTMTGSSGGIGLLSDGGGNDAYHAGYFSQGASYWYALGILADETGHDIYEARRYSQGTGVHRSIGVLWDGGGNDQYAIGYGVSQGCGHDESIGLLLDREGDDLYQGGVMVQGAGNAGGFGALLDERGADVYYNKTPAQGWGDGQWENGSLGVLMDLGNSLDHYSSEGENNSIRVERKWGLLVDGE